MSEVIDIKDKVTIPRDAKVKVYWQDTPENYSKDNKTRIRDIYNAKQ